MDACYEAHALAGAGTGPDSVDGICSIVPVLFEGVQQRLEITMARNVVEANQRLQIRMSPVKKARIARAAAIQQVDLTQFVTESALREADAVIERAEHIELTEREYLRIMELLENPPAPNARLKAAIAALPDDL
jgi:uncharacterized protein (DUF1778 family)